MEFVLNHHQFQMISDHLNPIFRQKTFRKSHRWVIRYSLLQFNDGHLVITHQNGGHFENDLQITLRRWEKRNPTILHTIL